jgi:hypothetical protein
VHLNLGPIVFAPPVGEKRGRDFQFPTLYGLNPSGMCEFKPEREFSKAVAFIVILLNRFPVM